MKSDEVQQMLDSLAEEMEAQNLKVTITEENGKFAYNYYYQVEIDESMIPLMADSLETTMDEQADTLKAAAKALKLVVVDENPTIVFHYYTMDGKEIYSCEFTAD